MKNLINLEDYKNNRERIKSLCKGQIEIYICGNCGKHIEVVNNHKPKYCPQCRREVEYQE